MYHAINRAQTCVPAAAPALQPSPHVQGNYCHPSFWSERTNASELIQLTKGHTVGQKLCLKKEKKQVSGAIRQHSFSCRWAVGCEYLPDCQPGSAQSWEMEHSQSHGCRCQSQKLCAGAPSAVIETNLEIGRLSNFWIPVPDVVSFVILLFPLTFTKGNLNFQAIVEKHAVVRLRLCRPGLQQVSWLM